MARLWDLGSIVPPVARLRDERNRLSAEVIDLRDRLLRTEAECRERERNQTDLADAVSSLRRESDLLHRETTALRGEVAALTPAEPAYRLFPEGHFYSPIPDLPDVRARSGAIFDRTGDVPGVELGLDRQLDLLAALEPAIRRWPHGDTAGRVGRRFQPDNGYFGWTDAQLWYGLLATRRPRRVVEIGSGWSTALLLDACDDESLDTQVTAVEPYPERLRAVLRPGDERRVTLLERRVQELHSSELADIDAGDVLFIDSTHVAKVGSDVVQLVFEVLPRLRPGVLVHIHDIAYPFEYPQEWVEEGRAWNEAYLVRAFLVDNPRWRVALWPSLLWLREADRMRSTLHPDTLVDGGSLWLETVAPAPAAG